MEEKKLHNIIYNFNAWCLIFMVWTRVGMQKLCFNNEYTMLYVTYVLLVFDVGVPDWKVGKEVSTSLLELELDYICLYVLLYLILPLCFLVMVVIRDYILLTTWNNGFYNWIVNVWSLLSNPYCLSVNGQQNFRNLLAFLIMIYCHAFVSDVWL